MKRKNSSTSSTVTQSTLAQTLGLARGTISKAIRDDPTIPKETRNRVKELARKMGYQVNNQASQLASLRAQNSSAFKEEIAIIIGFPQQYPLNDQLPEYRQIIEGINEKASQLGYSHKVFWYYDSKLSGQALFNTLKSRNINGLLLLAIAEEEIKFPLDSFTCTNIIPSSNIITDTLQFPTITLDQSSSMRYALKQCLQLGYKRIGIVISELYHKRTQEILPHVVDVFSQQNSIISVPKLILQNETSQNTKREQLKNWLTQNKPELIIHYVNIASLLKDLGYSSPQDIGTCSLRVMAPEESGLIIPYKQIGNYAAQAIINQLHNNQRGAPETNSKICIQQPWQPGKTLRRIS